MCTVTLEGSGAMKELAVYMLLQLQASPYLELSDDFIANGCSFSLLLTFVCCLMFKVATLTELSKIRTQMSDEQRGDLKGLRRVAQGRRHWWPRRRRPRSLWSPVVARPTPQAA